jgi:hypothetical protein
MFHHRARWSTVCCLLLNLERTKHPRWSMHSFAAPYAVNYFRYIFICYEDTWWRSWSRHCATTRKVASSIPDSVTGIFHWNNPSGRTMDLGLTQPLTEMSIRNISWRGKGGRCVGLTNLPPSCADCLEMWEPQPPETLWARPGFLMGLL